MHFLMSVFFFGLLSLNRAQFNRSNLTELDAKEPILTNVSRFYGKPDLETGVLLNTLNNPNNPEELGSYVEGDILLPIESGRASLLNETYRWPRGIVPYAINGNFSVRELALIFRAMRRYREETCIRFVPRIREVDYISIENERTGCWSIIGRVGSKQRMNLQSPGCVIKVGTVIHEMMHALGFFHEHTREDRDNYVSINWSNIEKIRKPNFDKVVAGKTTDFGVRYAFGSVMHYSKNSFAINPKLDTIIAKVNSSDVRLMGQRENFAREDIVRIRMMYKCT